MQKISSRRAFQYFSVDSKSNSRHVCSKQGRSTFFDLKIPANENVNLVQSRARGLIKNRNFWNSWISAREVTQLYPQNCISSAKNVDFSLRGKYFIFWTIVLGLKKRKNVYSIYLRKYAKCTITCFLLRSNLKQNFTVALLF